MRTLALLAALLWLPAYQHVLQAQRQAAFRRIDREISLMPIEQDIPLEALAQRLVQPARNDVERARAIFVWETQNIRYEMDSLSMLDRGFYRTQAADTVLKRRTAICFGYAELYTALCRAAGLQAETIRGVVRLPDGVVADTGHVWNAVWLDNRWQFVDPTWGALPPPAMLPVLEHFDDHFFLQAPEYFILSHLPNDPMWQLLQTPLQFEAFAGLDMGRPYEPSANAGFAFNDTIAAWKAMPWPECARNTNRRVRSYQQGNKLALLNHGNEILYKAAAMADTLVTYLNAIALGLEILPDTAVLRAKIRETNEMIGLGMQLQADGLDSTLLKLHLSQNLFRDKPVFSIILNALFDCAVYNNDLRLAQMGKLKPDWQPQFERTMETVQTLTTIRKHPWADPEPYRHLRIIEWSTLEDLALLETLYCSDHIPDYDNPKAVELFEKHLTNAEKVLDNLLKDMEAGRAEMAFFEIPNPDSMISRIAFDAGFIQLQLGLHHFSKAEEKVQTWAAATINQDLKKIDDRAAQIRAGQEYLQKADQIAARYKIPATQISTNQARAYGYYVEGAFYHAAVNARVKAAPTGTAFDNNVPIMKSLLQKSITVLEKAEKAAAAEPGNRLLIPIRGLLNTVREAKAQLDSY